MPHYEHYERIRARTKLPTNMKANIYTSAFKGDKGDDGIDATHSWNGTVLTITSASGTSSANLKGEKGDPGLGFTIYRTYPTVDELLADNTCPVGRFGLINTNNVEDPDNSKLYLMTESGWVYQTDLSGSQGIKGDTPIKGVDYWTLEEQQEVQNAIDAANAGATNANAATADANLAASNASEATSKANAAAETANTAAEAANAAKSDTEAAISTAYTAASQADTAREAAQAVADNVGLYMSRAVEAATSAEASKSAAAISETNAATSAQTSSEKAAEATLAASNAAHSENSASQSERSAAVSEANASSSASLAKLSASAAKTSETNAKVSEIAAASSSASAASSETNAKASETAAASSSSAARASETAAATSASTASMKADAAASSESAAATSANSASASKDAAATSESNAAASEAAAKAAADRAEIIAGFTVETEVTQSSTNPVASSAVYNYVSQMFADFTAVTFEIVENYAALPTIGIAGTFYFVPAASTGTSDMYSEYVWLNGQYEKFGDIQLPDLSPYAKMTWVTEQLSTQLASYYTKTEADGLLAGKQDMLTIDAVPTADSTNPVQSGGVKSALASKADTSTVSTLSDTMNTLSGTVANKQDVLTFDSSPVNGSNNPITSGGVFTALSLKANSTDLRALSNKVDEKAEASELESLSSIVAGKQDALTFDTIPSANSDNPVKSGGVYSALASKADVSTVSNLNDTVSNLNEVVIGKQDTLIFDSEPTTGSNNPVTSAGIKEYVDSKAANIEYLSNAEFLALLGA